MNFLTPVIFSVIFYLFGLCLVLVVYVDSSSKNEVQIKNWNSNLYYFIPLLLILLIGFRPIGENGFMDSSMYENWFLNSSQISNNVVKRDMLFGYLILFSTYFTNVRGFFILCTFISVILLVLISKKISKKFWVLFFISYVSSLYYWDYNVYAFRQGLAEILFLYAIFSKNNYIKIIIILIALGIHKSVIIPVLIYFLIYFLDKVYRSLYFIWIVLIPISYFFSEKVMSLIAKIIPDERVKFYLTTDINHKIFRWDMIAYNSIFIAASYYYIFIDKIKDKTYFKIVNLFLLTNCCFLFFIRVSNAHRFTYLYLFLSPLIIFYPYFLANNTRLKDNYKMFAKTLVVLYSFVILHFIKITFF